MKKHLQVVLVGLLMLFIFSWFLYDNSRNRFAQQADDSGSKSLTGGGAPLVGKLEWTWYDLKFRAMDRLGMAGHDRAPGVLVAKIDDASLERYGSWPWNRSIYDEILSYLYELGAEVVSFDAVFSEAEFEKRYLREYLRWTGPGTPQSLQQRVGLNDENADVLSEKLPEIGNQIFGSAVFRNPKTVLGYFWQAGAACNRLYDPANPEHSKDGKVLTREEATQAGLIHVETLVDSLSTLSNQGFGNDQFPPFEGRGESPLFMGACPTVNRAEISGKSRYQGFFSAVSDSDGIFRRIPLVTGFISPFVPQGNRDFLPSEWFTQATVFPSLAIESVSAYWDSPQRHVEFAKDGHGRTVMKTLVIDRKNGDPLRIETLPDGTLPLNFYGTQVKRNKPIGEFSLANIQQVMDPAFQDRYKLDPIRPLSKQIVVIGPTALGVYDLRPNPVQGDAGGVFLHATMIGRLLELAQDPHALFAMHFADFRTQVLILWGLGLLVIFWLTRVRALGGISGTLLLVLLFLAIDFYLFSKKAFVLDSMTVTLGLAGTSLGIFALKYFTEERERAFVKGAFEKYVSPDLVGQIMEDPKKLNLGGKKAELSVLFSDVRGFTTISEKMDAAGLARFMNEYLSPMTDIVQANKGTIDKYMGDAIMAIFGAPIEFTDHAQRAVDAGLDMLAKLPALVKEWSARGLPPIDIGIGVNTGEMSVGNMGSSKIFSYTVMGDSVNLGSRLEGINKEYGTNLIVSEFTRAQLPAEYLCRELDRVKVKGKKLPVTIFEVMGKGDLAAKKPIQEKFEQALQLYYAKKFEEAKSLFAAQAEIDKTSKIYVERCDSWMQEPPEADWDGSWTMKTK